MDKNVKDFNVRLRTIKIRELIIILILTAILSIVLSEIFPTLAEYEDLFYIIMILILTLIFVFLLRDTRGLDRNFENLFNKNNGKEILYVLIINLLFAFFVGCILSYIDFLIGMTDPTWISIWDVDSVNMDSNAIILDAISGIIFAPIIEEIIFRGIIFNRLKIRIGITSAMIISSFLFAIGHGFGGITSAFLFGICMCILYLKTDNILIPMSVHFLNNTIATILTNSQTDIIVSQLPWIIPFSIISLIGSIFLIIYIIQEHKSLKKQYSKKYELI